MIDKIIDAQVLLMNFLVLEIDSCIKVFKHHSIVIVILQEIFDWQIFDVSSSIYIDNFFYVVDALEFGSCEVYRL